MDSSHPDWRVMVPHCGFDLHFSDNEWCWASFHVFFSHLYVLRKAFLSLLAILWNSAFKWVYLSFSPCFLLLFFSQLFVRSPRTAILLFCISFSWGWSWSLSPVQCTNLCPVSLCVLFSYAEPGTLWVLMQPGKLALEELPHLLGYKLCSDPSSQTLIRQLCYQWLRV